jgi:hypothetical protein
MKLRASFSTSRRRGITLIECLVYIGALAIVFGLGTAAFYRSLENSTDLRRNADDITQALQAGERWRADLRAAAQPPRFDAASQILHIPHATNEIAYRFAENKIERRATTNDDWKPILSRVAQSAMSPDPRPHVSAWRWELELKTRRQPASLRPLFTFTAATIQP